MHLYPQHFQSHRSRSLEPNITSYIQYQSPASNLQKQPSFHIEKNSQHNTTPIQITINHALRLLGTTTRFTSLPIVHTHLRISSFLHPPMFPTQTQPKSLYIPDSCHVFQSGNTHSPQPQPTYSCFISPRPRPCVQATPRTASSSSILPLSFPINKSNLPYPCVSHRSVSPPTPPLTSLPPLLSLRCLRNRRNSTPNPKTSSWVGGTPPFALPYLN